MVELGASTSSLSPSEIARAVQPDLSSCTNCSYNVSQLYPLTAEQKERTANVTAQQQLRVATVNSTVRYRLQTTERNAKDTVRADLERKQLKNDTDTQKLKQDRIDAENKAERMSANELNAKAVTRKEEAYANSYGHSILQNVTQNTTRLGDILVQEHSDAMMQEQNLIADALASVSLKSRTKADADQEKAGKKMLIGQQQTRRDELREQHLEENGREKADDVARQNQYMKQQKRLKLLASAETQETDTKGKKTYQEAATKQKNRSARHRRDLKKREALLKSQQLFNKRMLVEQNWEDKQLHQVLSGDKLLTHTEARKVLQDQKAKELRHAKWNAAESKSKDVDRNKAKTYWDKVAKEKYQNHEQAKGDYIESYLGPGSPHEVDVKVGPE